MRKAFAFPCTKQLESKKARVGGSKKLNHTFWTEKSADHKAVKVKTLKTK